MLWEGVSWSHVERVENCQCHTAGGSLGIWTQVSLIVKLEQWITLLCSLQTLDLETAPGSHLWILPYPPPHSPLKQQNSQPKRTEVTSLVAPAFSALHKSLGGPGANHSAGRTTGTAVQMYLTGTSEPVPLCQLPHKGREKLFSGSTRDLSEQRAFSWWEPGWYLAPLTFSLLSCAAALLLLILNSGPG